MAPVGICASDCVSPVPSWLEIVDLGMPLVRCSRWSLGLSDVCRGYRLVVIVVGFVAVVS